MLCVVISGCSDLLGLLIVIFFQHLRNVSTAVGVLVLGVAAAAVLWRVKTE
jgi:hypothetical protein